MKLKTQHKNFNLSVDGKKPIPYRAHRDGKDIWVTSGDKNTTVFSRSYETVRAAKAWMNNPAI